MQTLEIELEARANKQKTLNDPQSTTENLKKARKGKLPLILMFPCGFFRAISLFSPS